MTSTATRQRPATPVRTLPSPVATIVVLLVTGVLGLAALLDPSPVADNLGMTSSMGMTPYGFLVVAHIAMVFGTLDPSLLGFRMVHRH